MVKLSEKLTFLGSTRFWKLVISGIAYALWQGGIIDTALFGLIVTPLLGSVAVRTVDRASEKIGK